MARKLETHTEKAIEITADALTVSFLLRGVSSEEVRKEIVRALEMFAHSLLLEAKGQAVRAVLPKGFL